ncbi:MAG: response regulator [Bacteroidia bacterium]|nr:response regulator [Bacteroidia bacterium]
MAESKRFKVLVVDDEPEILELLQYNFNKKGLEVAVARNGQEGLEMIEQDPPQIIVLDIMMPVMNGIEMCRQLRQHEQFRSIPILFLSATNDDMLILSAMSAGGNHFVSKPIRLNLLFELVSNLYNEFKNRGAA